MKKKLTFIIVPALILTICTAVYASSQNNVAIKATELPKDYQTVINEALISSEGNEGIAFDISDFDDVKIAQEAKKDSTISFKLDGEEIVLRDFVSNMTDEELQAILDEMEKNGDTVYSSEEITSVEEYDDFVVYNIG